MDSLIQSRLNRKENVQFRKEERIEAIWDYAVGSLFLLIVLMKLAKIVWDYFTKEYKGEKEKKQEEKEERDAEKLYNIMAKYAGKRTHRV